MPDQRQEETNEAARVRSAYRGAIVIWAFAAMAQEPGRTYRLGGVSSSPRNARNFVAMGGLAPISLPLSLRVAAVGRPYGYRGMAAQPWA